MPAATLKNRLHLENRRSHSASGNRDVEGGHDEHAPLLRNGSTHVESSTSPHHLWGEDDPNLLTSVPKKTLHTCWKVLASNYVNVLLIFVPAGIIAGALDADPTLVFALNFVAIIPLAALLSFATEELAAEVGQTIGGLLNASFGNAVELIVSIIALINNEIRIVQASMLGSILSNILLVLGFVFIAGGWAGGEQTFNSTAALTMASLLAVASASLIIPAALAASLSNTKADITSTVLIVSRGTAIILLILYGLYLFFQLRSHAHIFEGEQEEESNPEERVLSRIPAVIALLLITILVAVCADYLVDSIDAVVSKTGISRTFIGLILLPIVGNAAEHVTAAIVAYKGKMDLALGVAIGSSLQIAIFVTPFLVIMGWIIDRNMTLNFRGFETVVFFISVLVVNYLISDGKSNYLEGAMCIGTYGIIALAFFVYPDDVNDITTMIKNFFVTPS